MKKGRSQQGASRNRAARDVLADIRLCLFLTFFIATALCLYALLLFVLRGPAPFQRNETTFGAVLMIYVVGAAGAGVALGICLPVLRWRWGAALLGTIGMIPFYGAVMVAQVGLAGFTGLHVLLLLGISALVGSIVGLTYERMFLG